MDSKTGYVIEWSNGIVETVYCSDIRSQFSPTKGIVVTFYDLIPYYNLDDNEVWSVQVTTSAGVPIPKEKIVKIIHEGFKSITPIDQYEGNEVV
jgi:hypothetical protein